jgi:ATP-binding cassette, subfamily B, heavy metal transporter
MQSQSAGVGQGPENAATSSGSRTASPTSSTTTTTNTTTTIANGHDNQTVSSTETTPLLGAPTQGPDSGAAGNETVVTNAEEDATPHPSWVEIVRFIYPFIVPGDKKHVFFVVVAIIGITLDKILDLIPPLMLKIAIDTISSNSSLPADKAVAPILAIVAYFGIGMLSQVVDMAQELAHQRVSLEAERRFATKTFDHLHNLGLDYHLDRSAGEVESILNRGTYAITNILDVALFTIVPTLFETVLVTAVFWKLGAPIIALIVLVTVAGYFAFGFSVTSFEKKLFRAVNDAEDAVHSKAVETLLNYQTVVMFAKTDDEVRHYNGLLKESQDQQVKLSWVERLLNFAQSNIRTVGICLSLCYAAYATVHATPRLSSGDFVAIQLYIDRLFSPFYYLQYVYKSLVRSFANLEKTIAVLARKPQIVDAADASPWMSKPHIDAIPQSEVEFKDVSFHYKSALKESSAGVSDVSFRVDAGKVVALVGKTGSGKSTLMRLALRLYDVDSGSIYVDGQDITTLTQKSLRQNIGIVAQETVLFNNTLRYNIAYGKSDATEAEVWAAVRAAALGDMIEQLPEKLETVVGEQGLKLSGGERQRVGIARCIIKNPAVLLFDEATNALDPQTEQVIERNLAEVCRKRTTIIIAHRLSTVIRADEIIVLDKGSVKERGTHEGLLKLGGQYAEMWATYDKRPAS